MNQDLLAAGQVFAERYRIERFLAKGGFGAVYIAEQTATELRVAIKVLWPHVLHSKDAVDKFQQEARIAGRVNSEHIVRVFDAGFDGPTQMPFLVMELLQGQDLEKTVTDGGPLQPDRVLTYLRQVASGLDKAHGYRDRDGRLAPIVHRDLKPENLFLALREDGSPLVKILDFGIAKVLSESTKVSQEVKGTPLYMAFEQAAGGTVGPQTDLWALGLIAYFLLTGKVYWKAANAESASITQLFGEVLTLPLDPPSQRSASLGATVSLPASFDGWFARCVNRERTERFGSAGEAVSALARVFGAADTEASPGVFDPGHTAVLAPMPPSIAPSVPSASMPAVVTTAAPGTLPSPGAERDPSRSAASVGALGATDERMSLGATKHEPAPRRSATPLVAGAALMLAIVGGAAWYVGARSSHAAATAESSSGATVAPTPSVAAATQSVTPALTANIAAPTVSASVAAPPTAVRAAAPRNSATKRDTAAPAAVPKSREDAYEER